MARIYSAVLGETSYSAGGATITLATVPAGEVWVIREHVFSAASAAVGTHTMRIQRGSTTYQIAYYTPPGGAVYDVFQDQRTVLEAGDQLQITRAVTTAGTVTWWVSGYRLVALP